MPESAYALRECQSNEFLLVRHSTASFDDIAETCRQGKPIVVTYAVMSCDSVRACEVCIAVDIHPKLVTTARLPPFNPRR